MFDSLLPATMGELMALITRQFMAGLDTPLPMSNILKRIGGSRGGAIIIIVAAGRPGVIVDQAISFKAISASASLPHGSEAPISINLRPCT